MTIEPRFDGLSASKLTAAVPTALAKDPAARNAIILATLVLWSANYGLLTARNFLDGHPHAVELATARAVLVLMGCGICYIIHLVLERMNKRPFAHQVIMAAILAPIAAESYSWLNKFANDLVLPTTSRTVTTGDIIFSVAFFLWFFFAWTTLYLAVAYSSRLKAQERHGASLQALAQSAQLRALRYQVNPHFLFNTLNSISSLILDGRSSEADLMVTRLAGFFRASLAVDPLDAVRLEDEIALQKAYLEIEQVRFPDLAVEIRVGENVRHALVPTLILQPIIENAVKFAVAASNAPARICIKAEKVGNRLKLEVSDDGCAQHIVSGTRVGLRNVQQRLESIYGVHGSFFAGPILPHGFQVNLMMPFQGPK